MRAAIFQSCSGIDPAANAAALVEAVAQAKAGGADMLFTPEMVGCLDRDRERARRALRDEAHDPVLAAVRAAARAAGLWVHIGSLGLCDERADGRLVNRSFVIGPPSPSGRVHPILLDAPPGGIAGPNCGRIGVRLAVLRAITCPLARNPFPWKPSRLPTSFRPSSFLTFTVTPVRGPRVDRTRLGLASNLASGIEPPV